ncbi:MAG: succinyldiaminopimelate transaminase [Thermoprotei archaeon]|nr:MAG: succinyldiaminopimelate transaminase [Thermoprotei archaeon]
MNFQTYPFEKLTALLEGILPNPNLSPLTLTIGEPQFQTPDLIQQKLKDTTSFLNKYPKTTGEDILKTAMINFCQKRFDIKLKKNQLIPTFGTREVLFNFPQFLLFDKPHPTMAFTNPFYQIYEGAGIASRAKIIHLNLTKENNFKPLIDELKLATCDLVILNFPNNPTTSVLEIRELETWVKLALKHNFVLLNDECYSEIFLGDAPHSLLEASRNVGNDEFKNILIINSISKRSSAPGLRSGFIAGDEHILKDYMKYRTYVGCASPLPLQFASAAAWNDETHAKEIRAKYVENLKIAKEILGIEPPNATFYLWLFVSDDLEFTKKAYKEQNLKVLAGSFLGRDGMGKGYIRIALVDKPENTKKAMTRLKILLK